VQPLEFIGKGVTLHHTEMPETRSDSLFHASFKAAQQFDYFMLGMIGAIVAYIAQNVEPRTFNSPSYDIYIVAVIALLLALYCGIARIERSNLYRQLNAKSLHLAEKRGKLTEALQQVQLRGSVLNTETGENHTVPEIVAMIKDISNELPGGRKAMDRASASSLSFYKWRTRLFLFGVTGVFVAKVLSAYIG
jgi:hypothetical protein